MSVEIELDHLGVSSAVGTLDLQSAGIRQANSGLRARARELDEAWSGRASSTFMPAAYALVDAVDAIVDNIGVLSGKISQADAMFTDLDIAQADGLRAG